MDDKPPGLSREKYLHQYVEHERAYFRAMCNFTEIELAVFNLLSRGHSPAFAGMEVGMTERTVYNYQGRIWRKIEKVL